MKKLVIGAAVLACASIASAQTVTSANIVGYSKEAKPTGLRILGQNWESTTLEELMGLNHAAARIPTVAQGIYTYENGVGYKQYFCYADSFVQQAAGTEWRDAADPNTSIGDVAINNSTAVFMYTPVNGDGEAVIAGEVNISETADTPINVGLQLLAYPFSAKVDSLNDLTLTESGKPANVFAGGAIIVPTTADNIHLYEPGVGYTTYFLFDDGFGFREWRLSAEPDMPIDPADMPGLEIGQGFFYFSQINTNWVETSPYFNNL